MVVCCGRPRNLAICEKQFAFSLQRKKNGDPGSRGQDPEPAGPDPDPEQDLSVESQHPVARGQELAAKSATTQPTYSKCAEYFVNFIFKL